MKLSVITPSFNQGNFIERTILSVLNQSGPPFEYVVVDGASTDDTIAVLRRYENRLRWTSERDKGQTDAVNKGVQATDGEIICWLNSDDIYYPGALDKVSIFFKEHPSIDVVYGKADHIDVNDNLIAAYPTEAWNLERLKTTCFICQPAAFFRRRVVDKCGPLDATLRYCMDYEFWLRLGSLGANFAYLDENLAGSRLYSQNKTLGSRVGVHAEINDVLQRLFGAVPEQWIYNYAHAVVEHHVARADHPKRFVFEVSALSVISAVKWNGTVSREMLKTICGWINGAVFPR